MPLRDGFPGQRLRILARPIAEAASVQRLTERLLVTDVGHFPRAQGHEVVRKTGSDQLVVILCTRGVGWIHLDGEDRRVSAGDAVVIPPRTPHAYRADTDDPWTIWWVHVIGADIRPFVDLIDGAGADAVFRPREMATVVALIDSALAATEADETVASQYVASGAAWNLLAHLAADRVRGPLVRENRIQEAQAYLRANLTEQISVGDLARQFGLSASHFSALFKRSAGTGVIEYVRALRSARARELLVTTDATISEIAQSVGYPDPLYFSRHFRQVNGVSPTAYRESYRESH